jgi:hypothetical protein
MTISPNEDRTGKAKRYNDNWSTSVILVRQNQSTIYKIITQYTRSWQKL